MDKSNLLTLKQVASQAGAHPNTVRRLTRVLGVTYYCQDLVSGAVVTAEDPRPARFRYLYPTSFVHAVVARIHDRGSSQSQVLEEAPLAPPTQPDSVTSQHTPEEVTRLRVQVAEERGRAEKAEALLERAEGEVVELRAESERLWEHVQRLLPAHTEAPHTVTSQVPQNESSDESTEKRPWWWPWARGKQEGDGG